MNILEKLQENEIPSVNQNSKNVYFYGSGKGLKLMFVGNSITKHRPLGSWTNDCGMAASSIDKDYVHLLVKKIENALKTEVSFSICQISNYERCLETELLNRDYSAVNGYNPDIVIMFFGANAPKDIENVEEPFATAYEYLRNFVAKEKTKVFHLAGFYLRPNLDLKKKEISDRYGDTYISLDGINDVIETHGKFNHPNDVGMAAIADRLWEAIRPSLKF